MRLELAIPVLFILLAAILVASTCNSTQENAKLSSDDDKEAHTPENLQVEEATVKRSGVKRQTKIIGRLLGNSPLDRRRPSQPKESDTNEANKAESHARKKPTNNEVHKPKKPTQHRDGEGSNAKDGAVEKESHAKKRLTNNKIDESKATTTHTSSNKGGEIKHPAKERQKKSNQPQTKTMNEANHAKTTGGRPSMKIGGGPPAKYAIQIESSNIDDVPKYGTVIRFNIDLVNTKNIPYKVMVTPEQCCLEITHNDTDCNSMQLRPPKTLLLGELDRLDNKTGTVTFLFRNLYCRFRKGNCSFFISAEGKYPAGWTHTIFFNTYPNADDEEEEYEECTGVDQDPDRDCSPVDCAIKYKGKRNFYHSSRGRCEPVVECHTRGTDGSIKAYYDTELNQCHSLDLNSSDNTLYMTEKSGGNPADSELMKSLLASVDGVKINVDDIAVDAMRGASVPLDCNHGQQSADLCVCDSGWSSSGIDSHMQEHWCNVRDSSNVQYNTGPKRLTYIQELTLIICLSVINLVLSVGWFILAFCMCCKNKCCSTSNSKKKTK